MWNKKHAGTEAFITLFPSGYLYGRLFNKMHRAHRVIFKMVYGFEPLEVDHIDGCRTNNNPLNLRACDRGINGKNQKLSSRNKSGVVGVRFLAASRKWIAHISQAGVKMHLGSFSTFEEAMSVRREAEAENEYHHNHGTRRES